MKRGFSCELYAPSMDKTLRFNEIPIKNLKNIAKYIQNNDDSGLDLYFSDLLRHLCTTDIDVDLLDRVDKFCILIGLRIICINPVLELQFTCNKTNRPYQYKLDLVNVLQKITDLDVLYTDNTIKVNESISITLGFPNNLAYTSDMDIILECIDKVTINDRVFNLKLMAINEREEVLSLLPGTIYKQVYAHISNKQDILNKILFVDITNPFDPDSDPMQMFFDGVNNTFLEILKVTYGMNIDEIYELVYIMARKLQFSGEYIENNMTFAESIVYLNKYKKELADQEAAYKKQQQQSSAPTHAGAPIPMQVPYTGIE